MQDSSKSNSTAIRYSSYSKRHASFSSPREVPLPSPTNLTQEGPSLYFSTTASSQASLDNAQDAVAPQDSFTSTQKERQSTISTSPTPSYHDDSSRRPRHAFTRQNSAMKATFEDAPEHPRESRPSVSRLEDDDGSSSSSNAVFPMRPFSLPDLESQAYRDLLRQNTTTEIPAWSDRYSSASLPLPSQIPFRFLPRANAATSPSQAVASVSGLNRSLANFPASSSPELPSSSSEPTRIEDEDRPGTCSPCEPSLSSESSSSSSSSSSRESVATTNSSFDALQQTLSTSKTTYSSTPNSPTTTSRENAIVSSEPRVENRPPPRPISPFRAPQPPPPRPQRNPADSWTAMRRFMTPSQNQTSSAAAYPPPEPPVVLPPEPSDDMTQPASRSQAPYVPFLSHAPPPADSWIEVETTHNEYKLHVRLPGFTREGITLATKRRRILHVVADSWEDDGGHFERRISFGYDADLVQVRAEFDGTMLRIVVPRRASPITWHNFRSGPIGRA